MGSKGSSLGGARGMGGRSFDALVGILLVNGLVHDVDEMRSALEEGVVGRGEAEGDAMARC